MEEQPKEKLMSLEEIKEELKAQEAAKKAAEEAAVRKAEEEENNKLAIQEGTKAITDVSMSDIKFKFNDQESYEEQVEDVVGAMATVRAVTNEEVADELAEKKAEELKAKAAGKQKKAVAASVEAETELQKARRSLYEAVLEDFMITRHLPQWLMVILVFILSPIYLAKIILINVPFGFGKTLMDGIDSIFVRYEKVTETNKPKVRATIWVLLAAAVITAIILVVFKIIGKI